MACLNPRKKVVDIIAQGLDIHKCIPPFDEREEKVAKILEKVGLAPEFATRFPHSSPAASASASALPARW